MNIPIEFSVGTWNPEQELHRTGTMIGVDERNLAAIDHNGFAERQRDDDRRRDIEDFDKEIGGGVGAENNAFGPIGGEAGVVVGVEVGEEVGDGEIASGAEGVDCETGFGDELGLWERGGNRRKRKRE